MENLDTTALSNLLAGYTAEVTSRDSKSIKAAEKMMDRGSEVFIASLPKDTADQLVAAAVQIREAGLTPVPHIVARNIESPATLNHLLGRLVREAGVDKALVLGGDRDKPTGEFDAALQLIETGAFQNNGIKQIYLGCYPEGHPRISNEILEEALIIKLAAAEQAGISVELISQFCFDAAPIIDLTKRMRARGITAPFRVGVAGPASRITLLKYAVVCGVGPSLRALKERQTMAKNLMAGETPEKVLTELAQALEENPALNLSGVHFFTFSSLIKSAEFVQEMTS